MLDSLAFVHASGGIAERLELGKSAGFGDPAKARQFAGSTSDAGQYGDSLVEMLVGAWHRDQGHVVKGIEEGGRLDLLVLVPGAARSMLIECKRLRSLRPERADKELHDVNKKFRTAPAETVKVAVLHIGLPIQRALDPESIPPHILSFGESVLMRYARGRLDQTACVVLSWDDYIVGQYPGTKRVAVTVRRRARGLLAPGPVDAGLRPYGGHSVEVKLHHREE